ncbi:hypothetical protein ACFQGT_03505 [Natrialbaceae archaeon GCM10025810]|uniref:hypothetical protein n=1 Tax=Halovalidus salilacus TaxID=3075124 RepID=UPI00361AD91A
MAISHEEYEDESVIAVDFGPVGEPSVDVVDGTAIVVVGDEQYEFDVPPEADDVTVNDGIVTTRG